jgi:hypothetical protein
LRSNSAILRVDPAGEERSAVLFAAWVDAAGREIVRDESRREPELAADDGVLRSTLSTLGGCCLHDGLYIDADVGIKYQGSYPKMCFGHGTSSAYIRSTRKMNSGGPCSQVKRPYFSHTVTVPNAADDGSKLVAGPADQDEDFSWEDEDEDAAPKEHLSLAPPTAPVLNRERQQSGANATSGSMSPQRSDDSFDIVSSGPASAAGDAGAAPVHTKAKETSSDGDEDDEDEDEDGEGEGEEEEEEEEEESDWE